MVATIIACRPDIKEIGEPSSHVTGIEGTWEVNRVDLVDLALDLPEEMEITEFYLDGTSAPLTISFDYNAKTYEVIEAGAGTSFLGTNGTWAYDDPEYPTEMIVVTNASETLNLSLTKMVRASDAEMGFELKREKCAPGDHNVAYKYNFTRK